jgi:hypothetical protein
LSPRPIRRLRPSHPSQKHYGPTMMPLGYRSWRDDAVFVERNYTPMTVHEGFRAQVAFLSREKWNGVTRPEPYATAFFVRVHLDADAPYTEPHPGVTYAVTAKHSVIDFPKTEPVYVTFNQIGGGFKQHPLTRDDWSYHPETDVAVCEIPMLENILHNAVPFASLVPKDRKAIKLGDPVFTVGLYYALRSRSLQAIARFGNISLMPNEKEKIKVEITDQDNRKDYDDLPEIEAYLIEVRGWEGQSGSPVFVSFGKTESLNMAMSLVAPKAFLAEHGVELRPPPFKPMALVFRPDPVCIGLIQGYHPDEMDTHDPQYKYLVNLGIAIVVPSDAIIDTLMMPEFLAERERKRKQLGI